LQAKKMNNEFIKNKYQPLDFTEDEFASLIAIIRTSMITSKVFKLSMLKKVIL